MRSKLILDDIKLNPFHKIKDLIWTFKNKLIKLNLTNKLRKIYGLIEKNYKD